MPAMNANGCLDGYAQDSVTRNTCSSASHTLLTLTFAPCLPEALVQIAPPAPPLSCSTHLWQQPWQLPQPRSWLWPLLSAACHMQLASALQGLHPHPWPHQSLLPALEPAQAHEPWRVGAAGRIKGSTPSQSTPNVTSAPATQSF